MTTLPTVILLAGGDSTRLWPLKDKHSLCFLGKPLAYYSLQQLEKAGFKKIIVVVSDRNYELFNNLVNEFKTLSIQLIYQKDMRGMAGAVLSIKDYIKDESILIIGPSDIFEETLISDFMSFLKKDPEAILSGINVQNYFPGGYLTIDNGKVVSIVEKPSKEKMKEGIVRLVFDYFKNTEKFISILEEEKGKSDDIYEKGILKLKQSRR
jgi:bifunctional UDP-N-acetylglucosamine pyrophosphorylase/glucosamine-1-phosphate N-acetyltransferase